MHNDVFDQIKSFLIFSNISICCVNKFTKSNCDLASISLDDFSTNLISEMLSPFAAKDLRSTKSVKMIQYARRDPNFKKLDIDLRFRTDIRKEVFEKYHEDLVNQARNYISDEFVGNNSRLIDTKLELASKLETSYDRSVICDTSIYSEIETCLRFSILLSLVLYVSHTDRIGSIDEINSIIRQSSTLNRSIGARGNSFDFLISIDRAKLGCYNPSEPRFLIFYGEVKGMSEHYSKIKGSRGTYQEIIVANPAYRNIIGLPEAFLVKIGGIRYHLMDRVDLLGWGLALIKQLYTQIMSDYKKHVPLVRMNQDAHYRFRKMWDMVSSGRSPFLQMSLENGNLIISSISSYSAVTYPHPEILPDPGILDYYVYHPNIKNEKPNDSPSLLYSTKVIGFFGTSQNGKATSRKCGFTGRYERLKDNNTIVIYNSESALCSKNMIQNSSKHLENNNHNKKFGKRGELALRAGNYVDPRTALENGILNEYIALYSKNTKDASNFRRGRRNNWIKMIEDLIDIGELELAKSYQQSANEVLEQIYRYTKSQNSRIRNFVPVKIIKRE